MNKDTFVKKYAVKTGQNQKDALVQVDAFIDVLIEGLKEDKKVALVGFGNFEAVDVPERTHRNPKDGSEVVKPAHKKVKFKVGKRLKELFV